MWIHTARSKTEYRFPIRSSFFRLYTKKIKTGRMIIKTKREVRIKNCEARSVAKLDNNDEFLTAISIKFWTSQ